jgi:hypothetical protein
VLKLGESNKAEGRVRRGCLTGTCEKGLPNKATDAGDRNTPAQQHWPGTYPSCSSDASSSDSSGESSSTDESEEGEHGDRRSRPRPSLRSRTPVTTALTLLRFPFECFEYGGGPEGGTAVEASTSSVPAEFAVPGACSTVVGAAVPGDPQVGGLADEAAPLVHTEAGPGSQGGTVGRDGTVGLEGEGT